MEQKNLIERKRSGAEERSVIISLTEKLVKLKEKAALIPDKIISSFSGSTITETEILAFQKTLKKLVDVLGVIKKSS